MIDAIKARIDAMDQSSLCRHWRFAPLGDELLSGEAGNYFKQRLAAAGGFTPAISKAIGW